MRIGTYVGLRTVHKPTAHIVIVRWQWKLERDYVYFFLIIELRKNLSIIFIIVVTCGLTDRHPDMIKHFNIVCTVHHPTICI